ncbi:PREDICTED: cysteine-rich secretory protein 3-like [Chinchilla lanigera]|uniref:cysteine-rich secretory protein 3-like n=1 Tax=Chinchilla lanigera TaxID=34839 RepID=UPI00038ECCBF|nr:PREDICTED: cysteine-rich secretory protein 3-like [Chinchilla lanigera]
MTLFPAILFLVAVQLPSFLANEKEDKAFAALSTTRPEVQKEIVNKHNELRRTVSPSASDMLKMEWCRVAAQKAQDWADRCQYRHSGSEHRKLNVSCGENLFRSSTPFSWSSAIQLWYDESKDFTFNVGPKRPSAVIGHYTQVVWYSSFRVGCGIAYCPSFAHLKYFMVCHYCPSGNIRGKLYTPYKQGTPCASCPGHCEDGLCTNGCDYQDEFSNCADMKRDLTCNFTMVKNHCKASCNCEGKIYERPEHVTLGRQGFCGSSACLSISKQVFTCAVFNYALPLIFFPLFRTLSLQLTCSCYSQSNPGFLYVKINEDFRLLIRINFTVECGHSFP